MVCPHFTWAAAAGWRLYLHLHGFAQEICQIFLEISKKRDNLSLSRVSECGDWSPLLTAAIRRSFPSPQLGAA
jgi:hypothetical protein